MLCFFISKKVDENSVIEDNPDLASGVEKYLSGEGYTCELSITVNKPYEKFHSMIMNVFYLSFLCLMEQVLPFLKN